MFFTIINFSAECKITEEFQSAQNDEQPSEQRQPVEQPSEPDEPEANCQSDVAEQQPEILISVQTIHTESTNVQQQKQLDSTQSSSKTKARPIPILPKSSNCYICNSSDRIPFNVYQTFSAHTHTSIYNFICRFLVGKPSNKNEVINNLKQDFVCSSCLKTINEYDRALVTARRCKKQLSDKLTKNEAYFSGRLQNNENGNVEDSQPEASRIGLAKKRDFIDLCNDD